MDEEPLVRVVRGDVGPEELAALVTVLTARSAAVDVRPGEAARTRPASAWIASARPSRGPSSWRVSGQPQ